MQEYSGELVLRNRDARRLMKGLKIKTNPFTQLQEFLDECNDKNPRRNKDGEWEVRFLTPDVAPEARAEWLDNIADDVMTAAAALHMIYGENVLTGPSDWGIAPGGARWAPLDRLCHIADQVMDAKASVKYGIIAAGSTRKLKDPEKAVVQDYAPGAETEYDLCCAAAKKVLKRYPELHIETVCSPNENSGNDEVIAKVMEHIGGGKGLRIAIATTQIYHVGAFLDAARYKQQYAWDSVKVAGHCTPPWQKFDRDPLKTYLPECLTTYRKAAIAFAEGC